MSDDFGTVNISKAERAREIDALRQQYARHRDALQKLIADAPTEHLATEYRRVLGEVDAALLKVDELGVVDSPRARTEAGMRPLVSSPSVIDQGVAYDDSQRDSRSRLLLIAAAAIVALAAIGWLIWKASSDRAKPGQVVEQTTATTTTTATSATVAEETAATETVAAAADRISITPPAADYGTIRKGTRATRQFEVRNNGDDPVTISVGRSTCRCLYYEYRDLVPPKGKETVTVTIDGAKAKAGELHETIKVTGKKDRSISAAFEVNATIR